MKFNKVNIDVKLLDKVQIKAEIEKVQYAYLETALKIRTYPMLRERALSDVNIYKSRLENKTETRIDYAAKIRGIEDHLHIMDQDNEVNHQNLEYLSHQIKFLKGLLREKSWFTLF